MKRQVDISFAHNVGSAVSFSSNAYGRFGRLSASNANDDGGTKWLTLTMCVDGLSAQPQPWAFLPFFLEMIY